MSSPRTVAIALGSNLGDRDAHLDVAVARLSRTIGALRASSRYQTEPVDVVGDQPMFLNMAVVGTTTLEPHELLRRLQAIEAEQGRQRPYPNAPRTLDVDLILLGDLVVADAELTLPHPRFRGRRFVLQPLAEIAPDLRDPVTGLGVRELLARLG